MRCPDCGSDDVLEWADVVYAILLSGKEKSPDILIQPEIFIIPDHCKKSSKICNPQL